MLKIVAFALKASDTETESVADDNGEIIEVPAIVSVVFTLSDGDAVEADPDDDPVKAALTALYDRGATWAYPVEVEEDDLEWLSWARSLVPEPVAAPSDDDGESSNELAGDIVNGGDEEEVKASEIGEGAEVEIGDDGELVGDGPEIPEALVSRPGCKKPWEVRGWVEGRVLSTVKRHRGEWGKCEYRVLCLPLGAYRLIYFTGNRTDLTVGDEWPDASAMFRALLAQGTDKTRHDSRGKRQGHRMTINQFFGKRKRKPKTEPEPEPEDNVDV